MTEQNITYAAAVLHKVAANIEKVMKGQTDSIRLLLAGFASGGHILLEDYPGTGKTTLAKTLALSIETRFTRIQFTPDLLPSDILGVSVFDPNDKEFRLHKGPVFTNILLADEINRASPRTQSALLEAMAEKQVSIDGSHCPLEDLFFVIATQNPVESQGTYPLPEAQMDRFSLQFSLGYISIEEEVTMLSTQSDHHPIEDVAACSTAEEILMVKKQVHALHVSEELKQYIVQLVHATRSSPGLVLGAGPRASLSLMQTARALALFDGLDFVTPDHIQELAVPVIAHRLILDPQARFSGQTTQGIVEEIMESLPVPA
ncbi:AAA family ATPase [Candidatus Electrothrix sp.]|uniref:AAA family ATPase n=1 Tax=Candidatus Electrothrix sp. TaxID=2170559 RepID=UPI004056F556